MGTIDFLSPPYSSQYSLGSAEERNSFRFGTTWCWAHGDRI